MNLAKNYKKTLEETLKHKFELQKEYDYSSKIYKALKTHNETPDIRFIDFLNASIPDWTKVLSQNLIILIVKFSTTPSEDLKNELQQLILEQNQKIVYQIRQIDIDLLDCPFEIDDEVEKCDIKIKELQNQIISITNRIGEIEAIKIEWLEINKML